MNRFGNRKRTRIEQRTAAVALITMRRTLDGLTPETLRRSYGVSLEDGERMIAVERDRRAALDVA